MAPFDKLRILWIDDLDQGSPDYQWPERQLPEEYEPYFEIVPHPDHSPSTIRRVEDFPQVFLPFWVRGDRDALPAEIIAMDYVLSKWTPPEVDVTPE